ncbi:MAG: isochorismate synthase [Ignavibacterium sp.]|jgi:menaquinone-specific isochorismate synthase|nr:isochorismate synthase [Ignavibacterium sp.]
MSNTAQISANTSDNLSENLSDPKKVFFSYAAKISPLKFTLLLEHFVNIAEDVFYYSEPDSKISFLSFEILNRQSFSFDNYESLAEEISILKNKLVSNHSDYDKIKLPIFLTSVKFPVKKDSEEWSDFNDIDFIVPKIILFQNSGTCFIIANFFSESFSHHENFNEFLERETELIYNLESRLQEASEDRTSLRDINVNNEFENWKNKIESVIDEIKREKIDKVVIARRVENIITTSINWQKIMGDLNLRFPTCTNFLYKSGKSIFFGSTPEILIKYSGNTFSTEALAGSIKRGIDPDQDKQLEEELLKSDKNKVEHEAVIDYIKKSIFNYVDEVEVVKNPVVKKLPNIQHLQTSVTGTLKSKDLIFKIISSLFPTPAVCGIPKELSLKMIEKTESFDRGLFSGVIGWFNADNYGEFFVTIRSALVKDDKLFAYAGCGIVEGSDANEEFEETQLKLKPILSLFNNADKN